MKFEKARIIPAMRYKDAKAAINWLCNTFGFERHLIIEGENDNVEHAQLVLGDCMIMLSSMNDNEYGKYFKTPDSIQGVNTQALYIVIDQIDEHYGKVVAEKAEILIPLKEEDYGGKSFTCRDIEGHIWNFGSYNPWEEANK